MAAAASSSSAAEVAAAGEVRMTDEVVASLELASVHSDYVAQVNSIAFTDDGRYVATSSHDDSIKVFDCETGECRSTVISKRCSASLLRYTHHPEALLFAPRKGPDNDVRYLSVYDNRLLASFHGHSERLVSLEQSPINDSFMSASRDGEVRFWDLRQGACSGAMATSGRPAVAYDPSGLVFAVASTGARCVNLYDARKFASGPFSTLSVILPRVDTEVAHVKFSPDGKLLLLATTTNHVSLIHSFTGNHERTFTSHANGSGLPLEASFSACGSYVASGSEDGSVRVWNASSGAEVAVLTGHSHAVHCVRFSPRHALVATAGRALGLWLPSAAP